MRLAQEVDDAAGLIVDGAFPSTLDVVRNAPRGWLPIAGLITRHIDGDV